ncbi:flagellar export chaperone FliS [bacterium DOLZORAL124_64_63]|nr:MAG: flagellar export chaperone FliS [bacterium DOLZORAL124_64_63]
MYGNHGVQRYKETNINSISREKMIVMLYERMQSDLLGAAKAIGADDRVEMTRLVNHSQRIVSELRGALDHTIGGEVSRNLESLYDYLFHEHLQVLVDQDEAHIRNSLRVLEPLLDAWRQIPSGTGDRAAMERAKGTPISAGPENANETTDVTAVPEPVPDMPSGRESLLSVSA